MLSWQYVTESAYVTYDNNTKCEPGLKCNYIILSCPNQRLEEQYRTFELIPTDNLLTPLFGRYEPSVAHGQSVPI